MMLIKQLQVVAAKTSLYVIDVTQFSITMKNLIE